jgi:DNA repair exonuclease SbcCD ATPase subunit
VKIERIEIAGFGCLVQRSFAFGPGLNVILGPNESGKTTLLHAIQAILYGFPGDERPAPGGLCRDRLVPWEAADFGGSLDLRLDEGAAYRLERDFRSESTIVARLPPTSEVPSHVVARPTATNDFAESHLGMSQRTFLAGTVIRQEALDLGRGDGEILQQQLEKLGDSGGIDQSARQALALLARQQRERTNRAAASIDDSPLRFAEQRVQNLEARLNESRAALEAIATLVCDEQATGQRFQELTTGARQLAAKVAWHEHADLRRRLDRIAVLQREIAELGQDTPGAGPRFSREDVASAHAAVDQWELRLAQVSVAERALQAAEAERASHATSLDPAVRVLPAKPISELRAVLADEAAEAEAIALAEREIASEPSPLPAPIQPPQPTPAMDTPRAPSPKPNPTGGRPRLLPVVGGLAVFLLASVLGYALQELTPAFVAGAAVAAVLVGVLVGRRARKSEQPAIDAVDPAVRQAAVIRSLAPYAAAAADEKGTRELATAAPVPAVSRGARSNGNLADARTRHAEALAVLEVAFGTSEPERARKLLTQREAWEAAAQHLERDVSEAADRLALAREGAAAQEGQVRSALAGFGLSAPTPDAARDGLADLEHGSSRSGELEARHRERAILLGESTVEQLREQAAALADRATAPEPGDRRPADQLRQALQHTQSALQDARSELIRLQTQREERLRVPVDPAEIAEELGLARTRLAQLQRLDQALGDAQDLVAAAVRTHRREFAPRLAHAVSEWLASATGGRYRRAEIAPADLAVRVERPGGSGAVPLEQLSRGTQDVVELLLRLSVVDLLSTTEESVPLFFDDPLVHVDPDRTCAILAVLAERAASRQLFYFTQDARIPEWLESRASIRLHQLAS